MIKWLNNIREPIHISRRKKILNTLLVFVFGLAMGIGTKFLDCIPSNLLPYFMEILDLRNFFGRIAIWYLLAVIISIYSKTPLRASVNVFVFFAGMLTGYYAYTRLFAGFYPDRAYLMIWIVLTALSPFLAFICWYAKGKGNTSLVISSLISALLFLQAFSFGMTYFNAPYILEVLVWAAGIAILYKSPKQTAVMLVLSLVFAVTMRIVFPFMFIM